MGYRHYIKSLPKEKVEELRNMSLKEIEDKYGEKDDDYIYINIHKMIGNEVLELGKYFDFDIYQKMWKEELFTNTELTKRFEEYQPRILHDDALLTLANHFESNVKDYFNELAGFPYEDNSYFKNKDKEKILNNQHALERIINFFLERRNRWNTDYAPILNKNKDNLNLNNSWYYEYEVFDVLRLYKTFDYEKNCLIIYGY